MTTLSDTNVRPARRDAAGNARTAGRSLLARLLLFLHQRVSKLDRKLLLLLVASSMSACIIPAGPEFQDPAGVPNAPPFLISVYPDEGSIVVTDPPNFTVIPSDINVGDDLWVKWVTEYPPLGDQTRTYGGDEPIHSDNGKPLAQPVIFNPDCYKVNRNVSTHPIMALISDSAFVTNGGLLDTVSGIRPIPVPWTWVKNCMAGLSP